MRSLSHSLGVIVVVLALFGASCAYLSTPSDDRSSDRDDQASNTATDDTSASGDAESDSDSGNDSGNGNGNDNDNDNGPSIEGVNQDDFEDPAWGTLDIELVPLAQLEEPIVLLARSGSPDLYVAERAGRVRRLERVLSDGGQERRVNVVSRPVLDITEMVSTNGEGGLLGLAFSSDGRQLYVSYTDVNGDTVIAEYLISRNDRADLDTRRVLLTVDQPRPNHNGGTVALGPDGFLYIGLGDGGGAGDPENAAQNLDTLLGKILRIDPFPSEDPSENPSEKKEYTIPDGNPFFGDDDGAPEIWSWGARNPWGFSFDPLNGDLWVADVGQDKFEEVNLLASVSGGGWSANLGWSLVEGSQPFDGRSAPADHRPPIFTYPHEEGRCSVTGGQVYRGEVLPLLDGVYLFGDLCTGEIFGLQQQPDGPLVRRLKISAAPGQLVAFGRGPNAEVYALERSGPDDLGTIYRIEPTEVEEGS